MFEAAFMRVALAASIAASVSLSVIGVYLVVRRTVFLGLVLANAATVGTRSRASPGVVSGGQRGRRGHLDRTWSGPSSLIPTRIRRVDHRVSMHAAAASATVLILAGAAAADADTLHLLSGNVLRYRSSHAAALGILALAIVTLHVVLGPRFLLITFDAEAAQVAGVNTRVWSICLNLSIGVAASVAVHEVGTLLTFPC